MKCAKKIISIALVLMLALSAMVLPTSAAEPVVTVDVIPEYQGQIRGYDYYKFSVYLDSTLSLSAYQMSITWDNSVWQMLRASNFADQAAFIANMCIDQDDTKNIMYTSSDAYINYGGGNWDYGSEGGYSLMPGDGTPPTFAKISDDLLGTELKDAGYTGLYTTWMVDSTDEYLCLSGGTLNGYNAPTSGKQMVISWYMRLKDGVQPGTYEVGFNAKQLSRLTATYCTEDAITAPVAGKNVKSITQDQVTYTNAMVKVGEAGPVVTKTQAEVKMTLNEDKTAVDYAAAPFQFRVISSISEEDWNTYFGGNGQNINAVGFVAYKGDGAFDMETAKSVAMGGSVADYQAAKTDYIQKRDGQPANFGARIDFTARENVKDVTYIAFVQYDTDQYAFYDTSYSVALNQNYDTIVRDYAGFINA